MSLPDAFEQIANAEQLETTLASVLDGLTTRARSSERGAFERERTWLESARTRVASIGSGKRELLLRALGIPELAPFKGERGVGLQDAVVDAVEALQPAIARAAGSRSPLIETLFRNLKIPAMRKCGRDEFDKFIGEIEKRLASSYATRLLADPDYRAIEPALETARSAFRSWRNVFVPPALGEDEAREVETHLIELARSLELPCRQARIVADAALASVPELHERSGLFEKPKRKPRALAQ